MSVEYGLLVDYDYCTGCHTCEVACRKAHADWDGEGNFGIKILQDGPRELPNGKWEYNYLPMPTSLCDLCKERTSEGKPPSCVMHCPAHCLYFGTVDELSKIVAEKTHRALFTPYNE